MNCNQFEQLMDAYLDRKLNGSLRLEVDAHRLRCARCQQMLAMVEAIEHTIASNSDIPALSDDFTKRVMKDIRHQQPLSRRLFSTRVAVVAGMMMQAAAVLFIAIMLQPTQDSKDRANPVSEIAGNAITDVAQGMPSLTAAREKAHLYEEIRSGIAAHVEEMQLAGRTIGDDTARLVLYPLNLTLPDDITYASMDMASLDPWSNLWHTMMPAAADEPALDSVPAEVEEYSL